MMTPAAQHRFDVLVFWSLDRLSRKGVAKTLFVLQRLDECGVCFRSYTEQYLDSCWIFRKAVIGILATIAKQERLRISERTKAGLERARKRGMKFGKRPGRMDVAKITALRAQGKTHAGIADSVSLSVGFVRKWVSQLSDGESSVCSVVQRFTITAGC